MKQTRQTVPAAGPPNRHRVLSIALVVVSLLFVSFATWFLVLRDPDHAAKSSSHAEPSTPPLPVPTQPRAGLDAHRPNRLTSAASDKANSMEPAHDSIEKMYAEDDLCTLLRYEAKVVDKLKTTEDEQGFDIRQSIRELVFDDTAIGSEIREMGSYASSEPKGTPYGRMVEALAAGGLLMANQKTLPPANVDRAALLFLSLAADSPGNAAPLVFELALDKKRKPAEQERLLKGISQSTYFNSYELEHARKIAGFQDPRAISLILKIEAVSTTPIPDWMLIKDRLVDVLKDHRDIQLKIADLLTEQLRAAKKSYLQLGYNVLEISIARTLAGSSRAIPNFREFDQQFNQTTVQMPYLSVDTCNEDVVAEIRQKTKEVFATESGITYNFESQPRSKSR